MRYCSQFGNMSQRVKVLYLRTNTIHSFGFCFLIESNNQAYEEVRTRANVFRYNIRCHFK